MREHHMSHLQNFNSMRLKPRVVSMDASRVLSINVDKFTSSLVAVTNLQGVLKAFNKFLQFINKKGLSEEELDSIVEKEWEEMLNTPHSLVIGGTDFSKLKSILDEAEEARKNQEGLGSVGRSGGPSGPPPPPPGPGAPPPPPPGQTGPKHLEAPKKKMKPIHVAKIFIKPGSETLWSSLPQLDLDMENISENWEAKQAASPLAADVEDEKDKEVDMMALTMHCGLRYT